MTLLSENMYFIRVFTQKRGVKSFERKLIILPLTVSVIPKDRVSQYIVTDRKYVIYTNFHAQMVVRFFKHEFLLFSVSVTPKDRVSQ